MTGATCSKFDDLQIQDGIILTDQEIEQLLLEAEDRLQGCDGERPKESDHIQAADSLSEQNLIRFVFRWHLLQGILCLSIKLILYSSGYQNYLTVQLSSRIFIPKMI